MAVSRKTRFARIRAMNCDDEKIGCLLYSLEFELENAGLRRVSFVANVIR